MTFIDHTDKEQFTCKHMSNLRFFLLSNNGSTLVHNLCSTLIDPTDKERILMQTYVKFKTLVSFLKLFLLASVNVNSFCPC